MPPSETGAPLPLDDQKLIGTTLCERYHLEAVIARGGMGTIFRARQVGLDREVAVKMVHAHLVSDEDTRRRFEREAAAMTRLGHPDCVMIFDYGSFGERPFIVMEWVEGRPLAELLATEHPLPLHRLTAIIGGVCDALAAAHEAQLVHRDLKPENIIVTESPTGERIKLIDFGLAIHVGPRPAERVTGHGGTMGTPLYMSPEQCRGKPVDGRSDIYSLGVILFELLVGQPPFVGETPMEIFMKHIFNDPPRPSSFPSERPVPPAFDHVTGLALEKHPSARPQTALEFRRALDQALLTTQALSPDSRSSATLADVGRVARQRALGIATVEQRASEETPDRVIPIVEGDPESTTSLTTLLRHLGFRTEALTAFDASHPLAGIAMIYDIRDDPENALDDLARRFTEGEIEARGLIVVGPDSPFAVIEKALEIGIEDYVPAGRAARLLPRTLRRLLRRRITAD